MVRGFKKQKMTALCDVAKMESIKRQEYGPEFLRSTTCFCTCFPARPNIARRGGRAPARKYFFPSAGCQGGKNKTLSEPVASTWEYVTGNVNELECLLSAGDKIVSTSRVQSANCEIFIVSSCEPCRTA